MSANTAGFCMGVQRAVEMALVHASIPMNPCLHFRPSDPQSPGAWSAAGKGHSDSGRIPEQEKGTVLVRPHGVPPETGSLLEKAGFGVSGATCPEGYPGADHHPPTYAARGTCLHHYGRRGASRCLGFLGFAGEKGFVAERLQDLRICRP
ncbi:MAG: hypothetical protein R2941_22385 [Desulfobacterales bacterium]